MNIQNVLLWLECGHEDVCATVNAVVNNALLHTHNSYINEMLPPDSSQIVHILRFCHLSGRPCASNSAINCRSVATNLDVRRCDHNLLDYCSFGVWATNDAQNVRA